MAKRVVKRKTVTKKADITDTKKDFEVKEKKVVDEAKVTITNIAKDFEKNGASRVCRIGSPDQPDDQYTANNETRNKKISIIKFIPASPSSRTRFGINHVL